MTFFLNLCLYQNNQESSTQTMSYIHLCISRIFHVVWQIVQLNMYVNEDKNVPKVVPVKLGYQLCIRLSSQVMRYIYPFIVAIIIR